MISWFQKYHISLTFLMSFPLMLFIFMGAGSVIFDVTRNWNTISIDDHLS